MYLTECTEEMYVHSDIDRTWPEVSIKWKMLYLISGKLTVSQF